MLLIKRNKTNDIISSLNLDVFSKVASYLALGTLLRMSQTSKRLFEMTSHDPIWDKILNEYGLNRIPEITSKKIIFVYLSSRVSMTTFDIVHLGKQYWITKEDPSSHYGKCPYLRSVCWGEFSGKSNEVPPGQYGVIFRMKWDTDDFQKVEDACFIFKPKQNDQECKLVIGDSVKKQLKTVVGKGWFIFQLGTITLTQKDVVQVRYFGNYSYWYGGWAVDWFGLVPAGCYDEMITLDNKTFKV